MQTPYPYQILHVPLVYPLSLPTPEKEEEGLYLVFWWKCIAIGDVYLPKGTRINEDELRKKILKQIAPAKTGAIVVVFRSVRKFNQFDLLVLLALHYSYKISSRSVSVPKFYNSACSYISCFNNSSIHIYNLHCYFFIFIAAVYNCAKPASGWVGMNIC